MIRSCMRTYEVPNIDVKRKYTTMAKIAIGRRILQSTMFLVTLIVLIIISSAVAQSGAMYIYPAKGQDKNKQDEDRYDCHSWAVSQTGYDPEQTPNDYSRFRCPTVSALSAPYFARRRAEELRLAPSAAL